MVPRSPLLALLGLALLAPGAVATCINQAGALACAVDADGDTVPDDLLLLAPVGAHQGSDGADAQVLASVVADRDGDRLPEVALGDAEADVAAQGIGAGAGAMAIDQDESALASADLGAGDASAGGILGAGDEVGWSAGASPGLVAIPESPLSGDSPAAGGSARPIDQDGDGVPDHALLALSWRAPFGADSQVFLLPP